MDKDIGIKAFKKEKEIIERIITKMLNDYIKVFFEKTGYKIQGIEVHFGKEEIFDTVIYTQEGR